MIIKNIRTLKIKLSSVRDYEDNMKKLLKTKDLNDDRATTKLNISILE